MFLVLCLLFTSVLCACPSEQGTLVSKLDPAALRYSLVVPEGNTYVYDLETSPLFESVLVRGTLVFSNTKNLRLHAKVITIFRGGKMIAGSCDCPFTHKLVVEFYGNDPSQKLWGLGTKGIGVLDGGTLELFGPSCTQLAETALIGANTVTLADTMSRKRGAAQESTSTTTVTVDANGKTISITVEAIDSTRLAFTVEFPEHTGMVSFGFPKVAGSMPNSDVVIGWGGATSQVKDYYIGASKSSNCRNGGICPDTNPNLESASATEEEGGTTLKFTRNRAAVDANGLTLQPSGVSQPFLVAYAPDSYSIAYHGDNKNSGSFVVPFPPAPTQPPAVVPAPSTPEEEAPALPPVSVQSPEQAPGSDPTVPPEQAPGSDPTVPPVLEPARAPALPPAAVQAPALPPAPRPQTLPPAPVKVPPQAPDTLPQSPQDSSQSPPQAPSQAPNNTTQAPQNPPKSFDGITIKGVNFPLWALIVGGVAIIVVIATVVLIIVHARRGGGGGERV